jgi:hypothetical protein
VVGGLGCVLLERDRDVADLAADRGGELGGNLVEGERARAGQLVEPADVAVVGERRDRHIGDIVGVEERRRHVAGGKPDLAAQDVLEHVVLAQVLHEPGRAQHRQLGTGLAHRLLGPLRLRLAAAGQQRQPGDAALHRELGEGGGRLEGSRNRDVRVVGEIDGTGLRKRPRPRGKVLPVERRRAGARPDPHRQAPGPQALDDPAARLARPPRTRIGFVYCVFSVTVAPFV